MIGKKFNRLTVLSVAVQGKISTWNCGCDCGGTTLLKTNAITSGRVKSCGCLKVEKAKSGDSRRSHGMRQSDTYKSWQKMKERCYNSNSNRYHRYGGRGITVSKDWIASFDSFLLDMGERPPGTTLGRADNDLPYCKSNCVWATTEEQSNNKSTSRLLEFKGVTKSATLWAKEYGLTYSTLAARLRRGWKLERAITTPKEHVAI